MRGMRRSRKTHRTGSKIKSRASSDVKGAGEAEVCTAQRLKKAANDMKNFMACESTEFDGLYLRCGGVVFKCSSV